MAATKSWGSISPGETVPMVEPAFTISVRDKRLAIESDGTKQRECPGTGRGEGEFKRGIMILPTE